MPFEIPSDLSSNLMGLAWMIGRWTGNGHGVRPDGEQFEYGQQIDIAQNGGDYLSYVSQLFEQDEEGVAVRSLGMEAGFWRPQLDGSVDLVLSNSDGWSEVWTGKIQGAKIELVTDAVMRTVGAQTKYTGGQRLYGNVEGDLLWTLDRATEDTPLQAYLWARLQRAE